MTLTLASMASSAIIAQTGPQVKEIAAESRDSLAKPHIGVRPFAEVISAVLNDFPNSLQNLTGELVLAQGEFENYASTLDLPGAESCIITRYHSTEDTTVSWQAKMPNSDEYAQAAKLYRELYNKLQGCYVRLVDGSIIYLTGTYEPARKEAAFTTSTLRLRTGDERYREVKVELELVYLLADWGVHVNVISKRPDDAVGQ